MSNKFRASALLVALALVVGLAPVASADAPAVVSPEVVSTDEGPTGYEVTFRVHDPTAERMRIKGEWYFSSEEGSSAQPPVSEGRLPSEWRPGDFPLGFPNASGANWPVHDMVRDEAGVWSFTTPLPSGTFTYQLFRNCDANPPQLSGCTPLSDPANPPWNTQGSIERTSQVYVPSDPRFGTEDLSWQAPAPAGMRGTLESALYDSPGSTQEPLDKNWLAVYLPPGYDVDREIPYPLLIISHGAGGHEVDWSTQGVSANVVDNLIAAGKMQPAVVVATNFIGIPGGVPGYAVDVVDNVVPFMEANYNVATTPTGQAFGGLSAGGTRASELLFNYTEEFGYFGVWARSGGTPPAGSPLYENPALKELLGLHHGSGLQDTIVANTILQQQRLEAAGVSSYSNYFNGGHNWAVWRRNLNDFLERVAFRATTTSVVEGPGGLRVSVASATEQPAVPTGRVQALVDNKPVGPSVPVVKGTANLPLPRVGSGSEVTVAYTGDTLYNSSGSDALNVCHPSICRPASPR
jgi:enterochelin esterase-like enzyme